MDWWILVNDDKEIFGEKEMKPIMMCGHAANAIDLKTGNPVCCICIGIGVGNAAETINANAPDLSGRTAKCYECNETKPSTLNGSLAFFKHRPNEKHDSYYSGCKGWD